MVAPERLDFYFKIEKVKSILKDMPAVHQIKRLGNFVLYEIEYNSMLKKFKINLVSNNDTIKQGSELIFSARSIYLDLDLSYDFRQNKHLKINILEGLIASCIL